jgi:uncharacterized protein YutE (UPF0331/DUF86 family)
MITGKANQKVVVDRLEWVDRMVADIRSLPLSTYEEFTLDRRNVAAAESCLRRALEALMDLGRHLLAKVYATSVTEYKKIADELASRRIFTDQMAKQLRILAGYRNRLVHFYHQVPPEELYQICSSQLDDLLLVRNAFAEWIKQNPESIDETL